MKKLINKNDLDIAEIISQYKERNISFIKKILLLISAVIVGSLSSSLAIYILSNLMFLILYSSFAYSSLSFLIATMAFLGILPLGTLFGTTYLLYDKIFYKRKYKKQINETIDTLNANQINISEKDLELSDVETLEDTKRKYSINGKTKTKRKIIDYIYINRKNKLTILKQISTSIRDGLKINQNKELFLIDEENSLLDYKELKDIKRKLRILN